MRWPWRRGTRPPPATQLREESETRAAVTENEVSRPLREMRQRNHLADAVVADLRRKPGS